MVPLLYNLLNMFIKFFIVISAFFIFISCPSNAFSEKVISGEIINVNYRYKIAFTDLSSYYLQPGDILEVYSNGKFVSYLEVSESSGAISKLVEVRGREEYNSTIDFKEIDVGSSVVKVMDASKFVEKIPKLTERRRISSKGSGEGITFDVRVTKNNGEESEQLNHISDDAAFNKLSENYVILSSRLAELMNEKKILAIQKKELIEKIEYLNQRVKEFELQNSILKVENKNLRGRRSRKRGNLDKEKQREIKRLKKTIFGLKNKLKRMIELLQNNTKSIK